MLKAIFLFILSMSLWAAEEHATVSLQRWNQKLVVTIDHDKGWHTYWKNPGDAGIPSAFKFSQAQKVITPKAHEWPVPAKHMEAGDIMTIGYEGKQHFFFDDIPGSFDAHITMLICREICIPGEAKLSLKPGQEFVSSRPLSAYSSSVLGQSFSQLPDEVSALPSGFEYYLTRKKGENSLTLHYSIKPAQTKDLPRELSLLTGFPHAPFGFKRETLFFKDGVLHGKTEIEWDGEYQEPPVLLPTDGLFKTPYELEFLINPPGGKVQKVKLKIKDFSIATDALDDFYKDLDSGTTEKMAMNGETEKGYLEYLFFAFLGGLILNLMPCVLPVISLKLFGLIKHRNYPRQKLLAHNLSYTLGVVMTFMALALVIAGLKATGEEIGWGFQLQSPAFILCMMIVLFILSLNLFGLFEFMTPGGSKLGTHKSEDSFLGDFFSGVLTTILSTPCSAPFLGTALTFAFTTNYSTIFIMFLFIGLGLAFPFLMTAVFPQTLKLFPKPGAWMEKLKYFLGLSLIMTIIWLYDVFVGLVHFEAVSWRLNILFAFWFFAFFFAQKISRQRGIQLLVFALPLILTVLAVQNLELRPTGSQTSSTQSEWKPWTEEAMKAEKGHFVFVDFTAQWCLTCKVNKKLVLETQGMRELTQKHQLVLMRADWTRRDDNITQFLKAHGAVGVPAYFIQKPDGTVVALGETISLSKIESHLN